MNTKYTISSTGTISNIEAVGTISATGFVDHIKLKPFNAGGYKFNKKGKFGGSFIKPDGTHVHITKVLYNEPATVVWWSDNTITRNLTPKDAIYDPDTGLAFCILYKIFDRKDIANLYNDWALPEDKEGKNHYITLQQVRNKHKEK